MFVNLIIIRLRSELSRTSFPLYPILNHALHSMTFIVCNFVHIRKVLADEEYIMIIWILSYTILKNGLARRMEEIIHRVKCHYNGVQHCI